MTYSPSEQPIIARWRTEASEMAASEVETRAQRLDLPQRVQDEFRVAAWNGGGK
jgi:hypothetical protein